MENQCGKFYVYEKSEDERIRYRLISQKPHVVKMLDTQNQSPLYPNMNFLISSMTLSAAEDLVFFTTKSNQILKADIPLYDSAEVQPKFDFVHSLFHSQEITGLDTCIRKQLIVTCSRDKTVKIWNYATKNMEINFPLSEEALSVAFHPSGFHVIVAVSDKINLMNVLAKNLHQFKSIPLKDCREIQFCNGGHLFAAAYGNGSIQIFNFYSGESPSYFHCKNHVQKVRSICWFPNDLGLVSASIGGEVFFWDLQMLKETQTKWAEKDYNQKGV